MQNSERNEVKHSRVIIVFFILTFLFYGTYMIHHYAADTYFTEMNPWHVTVMQYFSNARWLMSGFTYLCELFSISHALQQFISWCTAIVSVSLSAAVIYSLLRHRASEKHHAVKGIWGVLASFMLIANLFMLEYFIFAEYTGMICLGILFDVIGARYILKYLETKKWCYYFSGIIFAILGINGHQGNFALIVVVCVIFAANTFDNVKSFFYNSLVIGSAYLLPCVFNLLQARMVGTVRVAHKLNIIASLEKATEGLIRLFKSTANFMPYKYYAFFIGILGIYFLYQIARQKAWKILLYIFYTFLTALAGIYAPLLVTDVNFIDVVPRTVYIMGSAVAVMFLLMLIHLELSPVKNVVLSIIIFSYLAVQYYGVVKIITGTYQANAYDRFEAQYIVNYLEKYKKETGKQVSKLAIYFDANPNGYAPGVIGNVAVNERIMTNDWAAPLAIQCLTGYDIQRTDSSNEVFQQYFEGKDWSKMEEEQFVILGDTLHLCAY